MTNYNNTKQADGLISGYLLSRAKIKLFWALPTVLLLAGIAAGIGWVGRDVRLYAIPMYEKKHDRIREADDYRERLVVLNTLVQMRPDNDVYRYNLALLKLEDEQPAASLAMMRSLSDRGHRDATMWLARRLLSYKTATVADCDQIVSALRNVIAEEPKNASAHAMLADVYLAIKQPELSEPHAGIAARLDPVYWLKFSRLMTHLGHPDRAKQAAVDATISLRDLVAVSPGDVQRRIQWSHALRAQGRLGESLQVLKSGLDGDKDNELLNKEMCHVITSAAIAERAGGIVDFKRFSKLLQQALEYNPSNLTTLRELAEIPMSEHEVDSALLKSIQYALDERTENGSPETDLVSLSAWRAFAAGDYEGGIRLLQSLVEQKPEHRLQLAKFLRDSGQPSKSTQQAEKAIEYYRTRMVSPSTDKDLLNLAAVLSFQGQWEKAIAALDEDEARTDEAIRSARIRYRIKYFHNLQTAGDSVRRQFELLGEVLKIDNTNRLAVAGLGVLERQPDSVGKAARNQMLAMLAKGQHRLQIHSQLGTNAIDRRDFQSAIKHLEQAISMSPLDPLICNNLAFAISESTTNGIQLKRSLALADQALKRLPSNPEIQKTKGTILLKLERFNDALHEFELVLASQDDLQIHEYLAETYKALGNVELETIHRQLSQKLTSSNSRP